MLLAARSPSARAMRDAIGAAPDNCLAGRTELVQSSSLLAVRLHRLNFYVVLRKLILELQAFSQGIHETSIVRFYPAYFLCGIGVTPTCSSAVYGAP